MLIRTQTRSGHAGTGRGSFRQDRQGRGLLAQLILGDQEKARSAADRISAEGMWGSTIALAHLWKALPALIHRIAELDIQLESADRNRLRELGTASFVRSARVAQRGVEAAALLTGAGIPVAAFKGLAVLALLWSGPRDRTIQDADLLVREDHLEAAVLLLEQNGLRSAAPEGLPAYIRFVRNSPGFSGNEAVAMAAADGLQVDLHWRVGPRRDPAFSAESILARAHDVPFLGRLLPVVCAGDGVSLTLRHLVRNNLAPDASVRDLLDVQAWFEHLLQREEFRAFAGSAAASSLLSPALAVARILARYRPSAPVAAAVPLLADRADKRAASTAHGLEDLFFAQLQAGPLNADLLHMIRPAVWGQLLSAAVPGWRGYRKHMEMFEAGSTGAPLPLRSRLWRLCAAIRSTTPATWRLLWALRSAKR